MGRVLGHIFGGAAVCHPILVFMPFARGAVCSQSRASAWGDEQPGPKVGEDTTQKSAMLAVGSGRRRCRGRTFWAFRGSVRFQTEVAFAGSGLIAGVGISATFRLLTASTISAHSAAFAASSISATSAVSAASTVAAASAVAAMFTMPLISARLLLTAGDLEFTAFQGRVSCAGAKGASGGGCIVAAVIAGGQHRSASGGRFFAFQPLVLAYRSTLDPFVRGLVR